VVPKEGGEKL